MEQLRVIGTEDGSLILADQAGERYRIPVDEVLRAELRRARRVPQEAPAAKARPKDIQAQVRAGLSAEEVAELLGVSVDDVRRYEAPVLAEREFVVGQALSVPVLTSADFVDGPATNFGTAVRAKLAEAGATAERWTSWKEQTGWIVKLTFVVGDVDRDARWSFDPRRSVLSPLNADATQLSRQGSLPEGLIPRLRALDVPGMKDDSRFDSGAFGPRSLAEQPGVPTSAAVQDAAIKRAPEELVTSPETADLLEALRRRRGQRSAAPNGAEEERSAAPVALFDALEGDPEASAEPAPPRAEPAEPAPRRKGRTSMPSWDEIVFGARGDEG
ncbi:septation protein SepH [Microbacterium sp. SORGH_AS_0888]|uniref:septation protein SepH n=1 Tax=Microbacterium sp. SORGH_AS_0888 TaxID=3041791 RepID=UPI002785C36C|nr:septation protein SepH [Microbacterium sp. SORGH_AS_0888]MDQ1128578.1 DNA-binding CsgD family transcriptional regulator [Microbacterium sp. SORGH_AS_0888]